MENKNKQFTHSTPFNSENAFPEDTFLPNSIHSKTFLKHYNQQKKKKMFVSENGETLFFMLRHFDQTMTILILHFSCDCFVIRINKIIYLSSGVARAFRGGGGGGRGRNEEENEEKLRKNERSYRKKRKD